MGVLSSLFETRVIADRVGVPISAATVLEAWGGTPTASGRSVTPNNALQLGTVYACVLLISESVASLPLVTYRRVGDRGKERAQNLPLYRLLHDQPNPWMRSQDFRQALQGHLLLWGNAFAEIQRDENGNVQALYPLRPDRMERPKLSQSGELLYRYTLPDGGPVVLPQRSVFHLRGLSSDGIWGYSPIQLQRESLALALTAEEFAARFFSNSAQPGGALQVKGQLSPEGAQRLATSWNASHQGLSSAHRIAVLEEGVEWKQIGVPMADAQFLQLREYQRSEIAGWFRVPPHMIGDVSRSTSWGSGIESQTLGFVTYTLRSSLTNWEQACNSSLLGPLAREYLVEHVLDGLLRGDSAARGAFYVQMLTNGVFSVNDVRELENRNPVDGGDKHFIQLNLGPLDGGTAQPAGSQPAGQEPAAGTNNNLNDQSGLDSVEIGRLLLNIQRLTDAGESDLAQKLRDKLAAMIDSTGRSIAALPEITDDEEWCAECLADDEWDECRHGSKGDPGYWKDHPSGIPSTAKPIKDASGKTIGFTYPAKTKKAPSGGDSGSGGGGGSAPAEAKPSAEKPVSKQPTAPVGPAATKAKPREFPPDDPPLAFQKRWKDSLEQTLSPSEQMAIRTYTGGQFRQINHGLRKPPPSAAVRKIATAATTGLNKVGIAEPTVLWRGVTFPSSKFTPGQIHIDNGFISTTVSRNRANGFAGREGALLKIVAPAGTRGAYVKSLSNYDNEHEFLMPPGARFKVERVQKVKPIDIVHVSVLT